MMDSGDGLVFECGLSSLLIYQLHINPNPMISHTVSLALGQRGSGDSFSPLSLGFIKWG